MDECSYHEISFKGPVGLEDPAREYFRKLLSLFAHKAFECKLPASICFQTIRVQIASVNLLSTLPNAKSRLQLAFRPAESK
ncbi:hypothetical protein CYJ28_03955 [Aerococcus sanguinicola]|uniref:Uncharacterized protein n=1 Tax=Aerococcus sanguinicola TaxID=119206 RepID=A0A2I1MQ54_9LACT|nr:hypothetical protein HMPREF3090_07300 [Aerococcus sp. HMSC23C02]PKZ22274.1 hypothetical protein CYJ28_03955 [Aerococcus sanguinicola]